MKFKAKVFGDNAKEALKFYNGPHDFQYKSDYATAHKTFTSSGEGPEFEIPYPTFQMTANKVHELVSLYGPLLYAKNPYRLTQPRKHWLPPQSFFVPQQLEQVAQQAQQMGQPLDPRLQMVLQQGVQQFQQIMQGEQQFADQNIARAQLIENYLNVTPVSLFLKDEMRLAIDEALIKGMGCMWTEAYQPPGSKTKLVGSFYDSSDNMVCDPDMETIKHAKWVARSCVHPTWQLEEEYGLKPGSLKGSLESLRRQAEVDGDSTGGQEWSRKQGTSNDLIRYWKIYSRMGLGAKLTGAEQGLRQALDQFGDNVYLVIAKDVPYPLNLPPDMISQAQQVDDATMVQEIQQRLDWPVPFWEDDDWPMTEITFHDIPRCPYPMSPITPALGYQRFLNWCYSFLAAKVRNTSRDFVAILKSAGEELKTAVLSGGDLALLEIEGMHKEIGEVVQFLQHPPMNKDIIEVLQVIETAFERATGLSEAMYGATPQRQMRSAQEAALKGDMLRLRPDDMAEKVESASTRMAKKEAIAAAWLLKGEDVAAVLGQTAAQFWDQLVAQADFQSIVHEYDYRLEAGSQRKPNRDAQIANTTEGVQVLLPVLQGYMERTGDVGPVNAFIKSWCEARMIEPETMLLKPLPPPPVPPEQQQQAENAKQQGEQDAQKHEQDTAQKADTHAQDRMQQAHDHQRQEEVHQQALRHEQQKHEQNIRLMKQKAEAAKSTNGVKK